jgi:hypothetical protein
MLFASGDEARQFVNAPTNLRDIVPVRRTGASFYLHALVICFPLNSSVAWRQRRSSTYELSPHVHYSKFFRPSIVICPCAERAKVSSRMLS